MQSFKFLVFFNFTLVYRDFTVLFNSLTRRRDPQNIYIGTLTIDFYTIDLNIGNVTLSISNISEPFFI